MSTTVTYKGSTIATLTNQTKTLQTSGKWMEANIVVIDSTASGSAVTISDQSNTTGTTAAITTDGTTTKHTLYFEYTDSTNETVYAYYTDSLVGSAITATTPTTHSSKTVTLAQLDGVTWYSYTPPAPGTWTTIWQGNADCHPDSNGGYPYFWITQMSDVYFTVGETWRVTINNTSYTCTAVLDSTSNLVVIGNTIYSDSDYNNGVNAPFCFYNANWGAMVGGADLTPDTTYSLKFEKLTPS